MAYWLKSTPNGLGPGERRMTLDKPLKLDFGEAGNASLNPSLENQANAERQRLVDDVEKLKHKLQDKTKTIDELEREVKKFRKRAQERQGQLNEIAEYNRKLIKENNELKAQRCALKQELLNAEAQMTAIEALLLDSGVAEDK